MEQLVCDSWRGSPLLVAQIARAAIRAVGGSSDDPAECRIAVLVRGDEEEFDHPGAIVEGVSTEGLRDFEQIVIEVGPESAREIVVCLSRTLPVSAPSPESLAASRSTTLPAVAMIIDGWIRMWHQPGGVTLIVRGEDSPPAGVGVEAAILRGRGRRHERKLVASLTAAVVVGATASLLFLTGIGWLEFLGDAWPIALLSFVAVGFWALARFVTWARPSIEVAPVGQTRLWQAIKFLGAPLFGLILTGLGKLLWD